MPSPIEQTGSQWFAQQDAKTQREILNSQVAADYYRAGRVRLEDFVGLDRDPRWGDSYHQIGLRRALAGEGAFPGDAARRRDIIPEIFQPAPRPAPPVRSEPSLLDFARSRPQNISVEYDDLGRRAVRRIFGRDLSDVELAHAVGAFDGSRLRVTDIHGNAYIRIDHEWMDLHERTISKERDGIKIHNDYFIKRDGTPSGLAARSFGRQVFGARALGVKRIETFAAGFLNHPHFNGYHTWPNIGYNAPLPLNVIRRLPPELRGAEDFQDLFSLPGGSDWWRVNGEGQEMVFDLDENSKSMRRFFIYLDDKQRRL